MPVALAEAVAVVIAADTPLAATATPTEGATAVELTVSAPLLTIVSSPAPPSMPTATASATLPESKLTGSRVPLPAAPWRTTEMLAATAVASASTVMAPALLMHSSPSPPDIPVAAAVAVFWASARAIPSPLVLPGMMSTAIAAAMARASASTLRSPWLTMLSLPAPPDRPTAVASAVVVAIASAPWSPITLVFEPWRVKATAALSVAASARTSTSPELWIVSEPSPPSMAMAVAVAVVSALATAAFAVRPFSDSQVTAADRATPALRLSAVILMSPELVMVSSPTPPLIPVASAVVMALTSARVPSRFTASLAFFWMATAAPIDRVSEIASTVMSPLLTIRSFPSPPSMPVATAVASVRASTLAAAMSMVLMSLTNPWKAREAATFRALEAARMSRSPSLRIRSSPSPAWIPVASEPTSVPALIMAKAGDGKGTIFSSKGALRLRLPPQEVAEASTVIVPWLVIWSSPVPLSMPVAAELTDTPALARFSKLRISPSGTPAGIPSAPTPTAIVMASVAAVAVMSPELKMTSSWAPLEIPTASACTVVEAFPTVSSRSGIRVRSTMVRVKFPTRASASACAVIVPVLVMASWPCPVVIPAASALEEELKSPMATSTTLSSATQASVLAAAVTVSVPELVTESLPEPLSMPAAAAWASRSALDLKMSRRFRSTESDSTPASAPTVRVPSLAIVSLPLPLRIPVAAAVAVREVSVIASPARVKA